MDGNMTVIYEHSCKKKCLKSRFKIVYLKIINQTVDGSHWLP